MSKQALTREKLETILQVEDIQTLTASEVTTLFNGEEGIKKFAPDGVCQVDPRNGERVVFNSARARRPHDNRPGESLLANLPEEKECVICQGRTTSVVDVADLSEGFTFINKNLFPILYPAEHGDKITQDDGDIPTNSLGLGAYGMHFLQWTSSLHDRDWQNMSIDDLVVVLERLAVLESRLLESLGGYFSVIKNYGRLVGGSLVHGHQQICCSNLMPRRVRGNRDFETRRGETFSSYLLQENPAELTVRDYGEAVLLVPYFMRRPFDTFLVLKETGKQHLYALSPMELRAVARGWQDAIRLMLVIMPQIGRETAYNITLNNGPGTGMYFEFLPYTQEMGGFEHLGLYLCQSNPFSVAEQAQEILNQDLGAFFMGT